MQMIQALKHGGYRANRFRTEINVPSVISTSISDDRLTTLCFAAQIPDSTQGVATANYMGREVKFSGDRTFDDLTLSFYLDDDNEPRSTFVAWNDYMLRHFANVAEGTPTDYMADIRLYQIDRQGNDLKEHVFKLAMPVAVGGISTEYGDNDSISTFDVTFAYQWAENEDTDRSS